MALVIKTLYQGYNRIFYDAADHRTDDFTFVASPLVPLTIVLSYLLIVNKLGPKFMENRKPFNVKNFIRVHNLLQIVLNGYTLILCAIELNNTDWDCGALDYSIPAEENKSFYIGRLWYLLKVLDLMDTVFYLLKKSYRQISFLHVYHHAMMVWAIWIGVRYVCGGSSLWICSLNSLVHCVMYTYYLLATYDDKWRAVKYKKWTTTLQMVQFATFIFIFGRLLLKPDCLYPKWVCFVFVPQNLFMLLLFGDFYVKSYIKTKKVVN